MVIWNWLTLSCRVGNGNPLQYSHLEKSHGQRNLVGDSPWGHTETDTTEHLCSSSTLSYGKVNLDSRVFVFCKASAWLKLWLPRHPLQRGIHFKEASTSKMAIANKHSLSHKESGHLPPVGCLCFKDLGWFWQLTIWVTCFYSFWALDSHSYIYIYFFF